MFDQNITFFHIVATIGAVIVCAAACYYFDTKTKMLKDDTGGIWT